MTTEELKQIINNEDNIVVIPKKIQQMNLDGLEISSQLLQNNVEYFIPKQKKNMKQKKLNMVMIQQMIL